MTHDDLRTGIEELAAGRAARALEHLSVAADDHALGDFERHAALAFAADACLQLGRPYEAVGWAERLRTEASTPDEANLLEAAAWVALGDGEQGIRLLDEVQQLDSLYRTYPQAVVSQLRAEAFCLQGETQRAAQEAVIALQAEWQLPEIWRVLAVVATHDAAAVDQTVATIPDDGVMEVLAWIAESPPVGVDAIVEALWSKLPGDRRLLALMTTIGNLLPLERATQWSARLRAAGLGQQCALLGLAARADADARERVRAATLAGTIFEDARAVPLLELAAAALADDDVVDTLEELLEVGNDDLVDAFVVAAASTTSRSLLLASDLQQRGAVEAAHSLTRHAVELSEGQQEQLRSALGAIGADPWDRLVDSLRAEGREHVAEHLAAATR